MFQVSAYLYFMNHKASIMISGFVADMNLTFDTKRLITTSAEDDEILGQNCLLEVGQIAVEYFEIKRTPEIFFLDSQIYQISMHEKVRKLYLKGFKV